MSGVDDPSSDSPELSPDKVKALKKFLSPTNFKWLGLGRLPGDHVLKPKNKKS